MFIDVCRRSGDEKDSQRVIPRPGSAEAKSALDDRGVDDVGDDGDDFEEDAVDPIDIPLPSPLRADSKADSPPPPSYGSVMQQRRPSVCGHSSSHHLQQQQHPEGFSSSDAPPLPPQRSQRAPAANGTRRISGGSNGRGTAGINTSRAGDRPPQHAAAGHGSDSGGVLDALPDNYDAMSFEERARIRKERTLLLRKQAQERISNKQAELQRQQWWVVN